MGKSKVPEIRFCGFTDDWEQRKFAELIIEKREKTVVEDEDILISCAIDGMYLNSELFSHFRGTSNIGYLKIKMNDMILSAQNLHLGNCNINRRFEHGMISPAYKVYELNQCDPIFMQAWIKSESTKAFFLRATTEGASVCRKNIVWNELYNQELPIPTVDEQVKIGALVEQFDHLITLHKQELDLLKQMKQGFFQKMFPKEGETVPEIRFPGFTDNWEQRRFDELVSRVSVMSGNEPTLPRVEYEDIVSGQGRLNKNIYEKKNNKSGIRFEPGDVLFGKLRPYLQNWLLPDFTGIAVGDWWVLRSQGTSNEFMYTLIQSPKYQMVSNLSTGTKMPRADWNVISKTDFAVPSDVTEQAKIGATFAHLDRLLTLHQQELDLLEQTKKAFLEKMFI